MNTIQEIMKKYLSICLFLLTICTVDVYSASTGDTTLTRTRKNSVYYELFGNGLFSGSLNYERIIPFGTNSGIALRAGLAYYEKFFPLAGVSMLLGNMKHSFEYGAGYTAFHEGDFVFLRAGYRYRGKGGLLIRAAPLYSVNLKFFWFGISMGYSF